MSYRSGSRGMGGSPSAKRMIAGCDEFCSRADEAEQQNSGDWGDATPARHSETVRSWFILLLEIDSRLLLVARNDCMTIHVALHHKSSYRYDRLVNLGPQTIRLRPAPHCRTPILSYSLRVEPADHFLNWQQDPQGNFLARLVFHKPTRRFEVTVDVVAEMTVINPFDFFLEPAAETYPLEYDGVLDNELQPFRLTEPAGPKLAAFVKSVSRGQRRMVDFLVDLNRRVQSEVEYVIRLEPGVQTCEETLTRRKGSCRDSAWLLV